MSKKTIAAEHSYGNRNHKGFAFCIAYPTLKVGEETAPSPPSPRVSAVHVCAFSSPPAWGQGYYLRENVDSLYAHMCILERTQRRIGIVDEK